MVLGNDRPGWSAKSVATFQFYLIEVRVGRESSLVFHSIKLTINQERGLKRDTIENNDHIHS